METLLSLLEPGDFLRRTDIVWTQFRIRVHEEGGYWGHLKLLPRCCKTYSSSKNLASPHEKHRTNGFPSIEVGQTQCKWAVIILVLIICQFLINGQREWGGNKETTRSNPELGASARSAAERDGRGRLATGSGDALGTPSRVGAESSLPPPRALGPLGRQRKLWGSSALRRWREAGQMQRWAPRAESRGWGRCPSALGAAGSLPRKVGGAPGAWRRSVPGSFFGNFLSPMDPASRTRAAPGARIPIAGREKPRFS